jgi:regulator of protease activity HflC (stomatin/prohibitin superfamily)
MPKIPHISRRAIQIVAGALFLLFLSCGSVFTVEQGERAVVTRLGRATRVADPGAHLKIPLLEDVARIPVRVVSVEWAHYREAKDDSRMESYSRDQQAAHLSIKEVFHAKSDPKSILAIFSEYHTLDGFQSAVIIPRTYEAVKGTFGKYNAIEAIQNRVRLNEEVEAALRRLIPAEGPVIFDSIQIQDIKFSDAYEKAIEARMQAEVEVAKVTQNLERERKTAEITVVQAQAEADANLAKAKVRAEATRIQGEAEARIIHLRGAAIKENPKLIELTTAEKWNGQLPTTMLPGGAVPFIGVTRP